MYKNISPEVVAKLGKFVFLYESEKLSSKRDKKNKISNPQNCRCFQFND